MKRICSLFLSLCLVLGLCACGQKAEEAPAATPVETTTWQEQYDLGIRYLSEGNYEEAIIAFTAAIEIDPKQEAVYLKLAEAYTAAGNTASAETVLRDGMAVLGETPRLSLALETVGMTHTDEYRDNGVLLRSYFYSGGTLSFTDEYTAEGILRYRTYYSYDGTIDTVAEFHPDGKLLSEMWYERDGMPKRYREYDGEGGYLIRETWYYDAESLLENGIDPDVTAPVIASVEEFFSNGQYQHLYRYYMDGTMERHWERAEDGSNEHQRYYDEWGRIESEQKRDENGNPVYYSQYDAGEANSSGALLSYKTHEYREDGTQLSWSAYDADGFLNAKDIYDAAGENVVEAFYYDRDGGVVRDVKEYDENGNRVSQIRYVNDIPYEKELFDEEGLLERTLYNPDGTVKYVGRRD